MDMPKGHTILSQDDRPIVAIYWPVEGVAGFRVGECGTTRIEAYDESGHMANIPWLAVFKGDEIVCRVPADHVSVHYK
jgi:hypothetical protein